MFPSFSPAALTDALKDKTKGPSSLPPQWSGSQPNSVQPAGAAPTPGYQSTLGPVNARQDARVGDQNISVSYFPDIGMAIFVVALIALVAGILYWAWG